MKCVVIETTLCLARFPRTNRKRVIYYGVEDCALLSGSFAGSEFFEDLPVRRRLEGKTRQNLEPKTEELVRVLSDRPLRLEFQERFVSAQSRQRFAYAAALPEDAEQWFASQNI